MALNCTAGQEYFVNANGIKICWQSIGNDDASPIVMINGLGSQLINWHDDFCVQLAAHGYRLIRFDNRDTGLSTSFDDSGVPDLKRIAEAKQKGETIEIPYSLMDMAQDAVGLLDALGIESAHFLGSSMGGRIGQLIAINFPQRVRTLTCMISTMGESVFPPPNPEAIETLFEPAPTDRTEFIDYYVALCKMLNGSKFRIDESYVRNKAERCFDRAFNPKGEIRQAAALMAAGSNRESLKYICIPTLIINGSDDPLISVDCAMDMAETITGAKVMIIEGMGHSVSDTPQVWPQILKAIVEHAV
ncbi:MAG TPA: alpha/beta hydrolase [Desulfobacteraceae bacterium]|nr:alpha/beta hydrolase [Desulfobacteraceae bacterium]HPJ68423.1 alpha/beta hydrolase [Desulfobacteraceae bacterium]HPQ28531.1 alpha/beta hydrolase [Desulfobacteraceae bacterium]